MQHWRLFCLFWVSTLKGVFSDGITNVNIHIFDILDVQDVDWEFAEEAADDDLEQGASDEEGLDDDPGYRKQLGKDITASSSPHLADSSEVLS